MTKKQKAAVARRRARLDEAARRRGQELACYYKTWVCWNKFSEPVQMIQNFRKIRHEVVQNNDKFSTFFLFPWRFADVAGSIPRDVYLGEKIYPVRLIIRLPSFPSSMAFGWLNFDVCQLRTMACSPDGLDGLECLEEQYGQVCRILHQRVIFIRFHVRVAVAKMIKMAQMAQLYLCYLCLLLFQTLNWTHRFWSHIWTVQPVLDVPASECVYVGHVFRRNARWKLQI